VADKPKSHPHRFQPGQSGNPKGRPRNAKGVKELLAKIGREKVDGKNGKRKTRFEEVLRQVYSAAEDGEAWAVQFIADRTEGKVPQAVQVDSKTEVRGTILLEAGALLELTQAAEEYAIEVRGEAVPEIGDGVVNKIVNLISKPR